MGDLVDLEVEMEEIKVRVERGRKRGRMRHHQKRRGRVL